LRPFSRCWIRSSWSGGCTSLAEYDVFVNWMKATLNYGTTPFTANLPGSSCVNKVCQVMNPGTKLSYAYVSLGKVAVTMTLRVYDV
jgi:hypothetical protein